ncbi:MAG: hypothetical protein HOB07_11210 [Chloroflexi bacterium]|jgi:hypothetical protein|nr:hypothetical protein [Chloroflexota bacterium]
MRTRIFSFVVAAAAFAVVGGGAVASANGAGGVTGPAFYVDGELYRTVGTPTDLSHTRAPSHTYDAIYVIDGQAPVAEAKPGDRDYNGGRWQARVVEFGDYATAVSVHDANGSGNFDSAEEVEAAISAGDATVSAPVASFVCPVIQIP